MIELLGVIADDAARHGMACAVRSMCAECLEELQNIRLKADR
jgi:hypothetical protein